MSCSLDLFIVYALFVAGCDAIAAVSPSGLTGYYYDNSAFGLMPKLTRIDPSVNFTWTTDQPFHTSYTIRWKGNVTEENEFDNVTFSLNTDGAVRLWVCDHLLIDDWRVGHSKRNVSAIGPIGLTPSGQTVCPITLEYGHFSDDALLQLYWKDSRNPSVRLVPTSALEPLSSVAETMRQALRDKQLNAGWGTWYNKDMLSHVLLPHSLAIKLQLVSGSEVLKQVAVFRRDSPAFVRPVAHSYDALYTEVAILKWGGVDGNITVRSTVDGSSLLLLVETNSSNKEELSVQLVPTMLWGRVGKIDMDSFSGEVRGSFPGFSDVNVYGTDKPTLVDSKSLLAKFSLSSGSVGFSSGKQYDKAAIHSTIATAAITHAGSRGKYGDLQEVFNAMQTVVAWNTIFDPHEGIVIPVSRTWDFGAGYVLFDWDNYFVSYMAAIDNCDLAHSSVIQITKAKTLDGFVPNFSSGTRKSRDRTEPPVGAKVTWEIYQKCKEQWLVELLYDDLMDWNTWFVEKRRLPPHHIICLGSDPSPMSSAGGQNVLQAARFESGLDNSPMYDSPPVEYDKVSHHMLLYDVGMASMFLMECRMLMNMATLLNRTNDLSVLQDRYKEMAHQVQDVLWDDSVGLYVNRISTNEQFYPRLSPTLFYPMLAGIPSTDQVKSMIAKHMTNSSEFCVNSHDAPQLKSMVPLCLVVNSKDRKDSCLCATARCSRDQADAKYQFVRYEGLLLPAYAGDKPETVALNLFFSPQNADNLVTTLSSWNDSSYNFIQVQGYCYAKQLGNSSLQLELWYNDILKDHRTCASESCKEDSKQNGYKFVRTECWVEPAPDCIYSMPSISRSDSSFNDNSYWRGRIWGPMVQLVYWGLREYAGIDEVDDAREALCSQSESLLMKEWLENNHVHENYNAVSGIGADVGNSDPFYHWGALTGFISLVEAGFF